MRTGEEQKCKDDRTHEEQLECLILYVLLRLDGDSLCGRDRRVPSLTPVGGVVLCGRVFERKVLEETSDERGQRGIREESSERLERRQRVLLWSVKEPREGMSAG